MPSIQWLIRVTISKDSLTILAVNESASTEWLQNYAGQSGIGYPMVYDADGSVYKLYEVGSSYGNIPPTYVIIDQRGVIRYRTDDTFNQTEAMGVFIRDLLKGGSE